MTMAVVILKNGREGDVWGYVLGFCSDDKLGDEPLANEPNFLNVTYPATSPNATQPCVRFQRLVAAGACLVSVNGLTAGDCLIVPTADGGSTCVPMDRWAASRSRWCPTIRCSRRSWASRWT
jgi:hypothetical protein